MIPLIFGELALEQAERKLVSFDPQYLIWIMPTQGK